MIKKIIAFIIQPFKLVTHRHLSEKLSLFFSKHSVWVYVVSVFTTFIILYLIYTL